MGFADIGYQIHGYEVEPWVRNPRVTHAFSNRMSRCTYLFTSKNDGSKVASVLPQKGDQSLYTLNGNAAYFASSNGRSGAARISDPIGSSAAMTNSPSNSGTLAVGQSGTARPLGLTLAFQLPVIPNNSGGTNVNWMLFSFSRDASVNPYYAIIGTRGTLSGVVFQRRIDGGFSTDVSSPFTLNLNWNVLTLAYTGSAITLRLNGVYIDNALPALVGGACTLDTFTIGGFSRPSSFGLFSDLNWTDCVLGVNKIWTAADWEPNEVYLKRKLGL